MKDVILWMKYSEVWINKDFDHLISMVFLDKYDRLKGIFREIIEYYDSNRVLRLLFIFLIAHNTIKQMTAENKVCMIWWHLKLMFFHSDKLEVFVLFVSLIKLTFSNIIRCIYILCFLRVCQFKKKIPYYVAINIVLSKL